MEGSPEQAFESFYCNNNMLKSLKGSPKEIYGSFTCNNNNLTSLEGNIKHIGFTFNCKNNPELKNIKEQIIKNQIKAKEYKTDEGDFTFKHIQKEFEKYGKFLINQKELDEKNKQRLMLENKQKQKRKINENDYGLSI